jgi:tRNA pseudouridine65 synthase
MTMIRPTEVLPILYEDARLIAVHKPAGLLVHRSNLDRHETRFALQLVRDQTGRRVHPVHRLDKGTSGVLVFAFDPQAASALGRAFEAGQVGKRYRAIVRGWPADAGIIDYPLGALDDAYGRGRAAGVLATELATASETAPQAAQPAVTRFRTLARAELPHRVDRYPTSRYALLELEPLTGRQHQIRRHLKHIFHPIVGDSTYGVGRHNRLFAALFGVQRLFLCCTRMDFAHPESGAPLTIEAPPADDFVQVARALGWAL